MNEYRCTRVYTASQNDDVQSRQGYYIVAASPAAARAVMRERFPDDYDCTCIQWRADVLDHSSLDV